MESDNGEDQKMEDGEEEEEDDNEEMDLGPQPQFKVESYFINVGGGGGDSAIHALIDTTAESSLKGRIVGLVLIDGGKKGQMKNILKTLMHLKDLYGDYALVFDSIVITHWDDDHYGGVEEFLTSQVYLDENETMGGAIVRCQHLKYYDETEEGKAITTPEESLGTTLYCPANEYMGLGVMNYQKDFVRGSQVISRNGKSETITNSICKVVMGKKAIGCDLFSNTRFKELAIDKDVSAWKTMAFDKVYKEHPRFVDGYGMPVLLCVGVDRLFAGNPVNDGKQEVKALKTELFGGAANNINTYETPGGGGFGLMAVPRPRDEAKAEEDEEVEEDEEKPVTKKRKRKKEEPEDPNKEKRRDPVEVNHASLMCVLLWPGDEEKGCASLYTGGDAEDPQENNLLSWLADGGCEKVTTVKAGHHGAQYATSLQWVTRGINIDWWITSSGGSHGHPTWQVLGFLMSYFEEKQKKVTSEMTMTDLPKSGTLVTPLMATNIPFWMTKPTGHFPTSFFAKEENSGYLDMIRKTYGNPKWLNELATQAATIGIGKGNKEARPKNVQFGGVVKSTMIPLWDMYGQPRGKAAEEDANFRTAESGIHHIMVTSWPSAFGSPPPEPDVNMSELSAADKKKLKRSLREAKERAKFNEEDDDGDNGLDWLPADRSVNKRSRTEEDIDSSQEASQGEAQDTQSQGFRMARASLAVTKASKDKGAELLNVLLQSFRTYYSREASRLVADSQVSGSPWVEVAKPQTKSAMRTLDWLRPSLNATKMTLTGVLDPVDKSPVVESVAVELSIIKAYPLIFTTSQDDFTWQFGPDEKPNKDGSFDLGISAYVPGQIFSLRAKEDMPQSPPPPLPTLRDLWAFLECDRFPKWAVTLFGGLTLEVDKTQGARNFFLFQPQVSDLTIIRLQMKVAEAAAIEKLLDTWFGSSPIKDITVIGRKSVSSKDMSDTLMSVQTVSAIYIKTDFSWELHNSDDPKAVPASFSCSTIITLHKGGFNFIIQLPEQIHFKALLIWVSNKLKAAAGGEDVVNKDIRNAVGDSLDNLAKMIMPRQFTISVGAKNKITAFQVDFEIPLSFGAPDRTKTLLAASLSWSPGQFRFNGSLWDRNLPPEMMVEDPGNLPVNLSPFREQFLQITPITPAVFDPPRKTQIIDYISLAHINPHEVITIPSWLPSKIVDASVEISFGETSSISFTGRLQAPPPGPGSAVPRIWLERLDLSASVTFTPEKSFDFRLEAVVELQPRASSTSPPAMIDAVISRSSTGAWSFEAGAVNLNFGHLYELFDQDGQHEAVMNFMENFYVPEFHIKYSFTKDEPSSFEVGGSILIGKRIPIELDLLYNHYGKANQDAASTWRVQAILKEGVWDDADDADAVKEITVGHLLEDIVSKEDVATLPEYITKMNIPLSELSIEIDCRRPEDSPDTVVFCLDVGFMDFHFSLVQIQNHKLLTPDKTTAKPVRMLRLAMTKLPDITKVPIITALEQPFDQMDFIWLSGDLTRHQVDILNDTIYTGRGEPLMFKGAAATPASSGVLGEEVIGAAGCHFQIIIKENDQPNVILDYVFARPNKTPANNGSRQPATKAMLMAAAENEGIPAATSTEGNGDTAAAPVTKSFGSLSIKNIGLSLKGQVLSISLDATAILGPIGFSLLGFTLDIDLSQIKSVEHMFGNVSIHGLSLQFNEPPVTIAGLFKVLPGPGIGYAGGVVLDVEPWSFMAAGAYEDKDGYKSVFIFAKLNGPLIELEFAEISGITGGFGYNSELRFPKASEIMMFPFVSINQPGATQPAGQTPMEQLNSLVDTTGAGWISRRKDSIWLAAGLEIKALQVIEVQAVLAVDISPNPKIGLIAEAAFVMPPEVPPAEQIVFVDLGLTAVIEPTLGTLQVTGELTPRSYILHPSCKLSGGFAMCYWFKGSGHEGDWVFSIGGYHPAYKPPSHYPVPPRLAIKWQYDANLYIGGQAYFAITPAMCMAGGRLDAVFKKGNLDASFSAHADLLIKYQPFYFRADMGVTVRAGYVLGTGKLKNKVGGSASADLSLWGPPMAGMATVSFWFLDFDVYFGPRSTPSQPLSLVEVDKMLRNETKDGAQAKTTGAQGKSSDEEGKSVDPLGPPGHTLVVISGSVVQQGADEMNVDVLAEEPWLVRGPTLVFEVHSRFPLSRAESNQAEIKKHRKGDPDWGNNFFSKPMEQAGLNMSSNLYLSYERSDGTSAGLLPLQAEATVKQVPLALWEKYQDGTDPLKGSRALLSTTTQTMPHIMGLRFRPPKSTLTRDNIPAFDTLQFDMIDVNLWRDPAMFPKSGVANPSFAGEEEEGTDDREKLKEVSETIADKQRESRRDAVAAAFTALFGGQTLWAGTPKRYLRTMEEEWRVAPLVSVG